MKKIIPISELTVGMRLLRVVTSATNIQVKSAGVIKTLRTIENLTSKGVETVEVDLPSVAASSIPSAPAPMPKTSTRASKKGVSAENPNSKLMRNGTALAAGKVEAQKPKRSKSKLEADSGEGENKRSNRTKITAEEASAPIRRVNKRPVKSYEMHMADVVAASKLLDQAKSVQARFIKQIKGGNSPDYNDLNELTQDVIDKVFDNPDALTLLMMINDHTDALVQRSLNTSISLALFCHQIGLSSAETEDLTFAGLLMDIGMALLPQELNRFEAELSENDFSLLKTHIDIGLEIIERTSDPAELMLDVICHHHERVDSSGYAKGIPGEKLSIYAQMAGISDTFECMTSELLNKDPFSPADALQHMVEDPQFDSELVEDFIKALGLYPPGSLVLLSSGKVAMVMQGNVKKPLKPKVLAFYSTRTKHYIDIKILDLARVTNDKIKTAVRPEEFDINLGKFFKQAILPS